MKFDRATCSGSYERSPEKSLQRGAKELGLSKTTIHRLKSLIDHSIQEIEQNVIDRSLLEYKNRLQKGVEMDGGHIENF